MSREYLNRLIKSQPVPFLEKVMYSQFSFSDFQKSEMVQEELIENGFSFKMIFINRDDRLIILEQQITKL